MRVFLKKFASDIRLIYMDLTGREILQSYPRDISSEEYWDSSLELMLDTYSNRDKTQIQRDRYVKIFFEKALSEYDMKESMQVLEVGCGFGFTLKAFAKQFPAHEFSGSDFSAKLIEQAVEYTRGTPNIADLFRCDVVKDPFNRSYDLIYTHGCLTCIDPINVIAAIKNIARAASLLILIELDFSEMSYLERLRFKRDRGYKIIDYRDQLVDAGLKLRAVYSLPVDVCKFTKVFVVEGVR